MTTAPSHRIRVLMLVENLSVPADRRVWQEALALTGHNYHVTIVCPRMMDGMPHETREGIQIYRYPLPFSARGKLGYLLEYGWAMLFSLIYAWYIYLRHGFRIIHGCNPPDLFFLIAYPFRLFGVRYVFDHHDLSPEMFAAKFANRSTVWRRVLTLLEKSSFRAADIVLAPNESYRNVAIGRGGMDSDRVIVVRSAPDLNRFKRTAFNPDWKRGKDFMVAYLGVMGEQDGVEILIRCAEFMQETQQGRKIHFLLMGEGPQTDYLKRMVHRLKLDHTVEFLGYVSDAVVCDVLSSCDLCVDPGPATEFSTVSTMNKILEYMAMAKPTVCFDLRESRVSAGEAALYAGTIEDMAEKILLLLGDQSLRERMGRDGYHRLASSLSWEYSRDNLIYAYSLLFSPIAAKKCVIV